MSGIRRLIVYLLNINPVFFALLALLGATWLAIALAGPARLFDSVFPKYPTAAGTAASPLKELADPPPPPPAVKTEPDEVDKEIIITYNNISSIKSFDIIRKSLYNIDRTAFVYDDELDFDELLSVDTRVDLYGDKPKILIFHTHSQEAFSDSRLGREEDTIIGVGSELAELLTAKYGIPVLHHKGVYDMADGKPARGGSYEAMEKDIRGLLEKNPSIEVLIDLHRDALPDGRKLVAEIDGRKTAQIMYFNGICRLNENGAPVPTEGLENAYLTENLALSLRMKLLTNEMFPGFSRKNYIKPYRYSLHMAPNSLLIEVGSDANTVMEAKNAMTPLAEVLVRAFS